MFLESSFFGMDRVTIHQDSKGLEGIEQQELSFESETLEEEGRSGVESGEEEERIIRADYYRTRGVSGITEEAKSTIPSIPRE